MKKELKRVEGKKYFSYKRRFGDRYDGWRIKSNDPFFGVIPHIMKHRTGSMVSFESKIRIKELDNFARELRRSTEMKDLSRLMIVVAAMVRVFAKYPKLNRFVCGKRIWARNYISIAMVVKKEMSLDAEESIIKPHFMPDATIYDVWSIMRREISQNKGTDTENDLGKLAAFLNGVPSFVISWIIGAASFADAHGKLPKLLSEFSPFHTSLFITDIGSTGISSVYHHLYDFGTCSQFVSIGKKEKTVILENGEPELADTITFKVVVDERIVDGFYYAKAIRYFSHLLKNPEKLLSPPETVEEDNLK